MTLLALSGEEEVILTMRCTPVCICSGEVASPFEAIFCV